MISFPLLIFIPHLYSRSIIVPTGHTAQEASCLIHLFVHGTQPRTWHIVFTHLSKSLMKMMNEGIDWFINIFSFDYKGNICSFQKLWIIQKSSKKEREFFHNPTPIHPCLSFQCPLIPCQLQELFSCRLAKLLSNIKTTQKIQSMRKNEQTGIKCVRECVRVYFQKNQACLHRNTRPGLQTFSCIASVV